MNETAWNEFLKRTKEEYKSLKEELEDPDTKDYNDVIQDDLESLRDEYEMMSQKYSAYGIENILTFDELMKGV